MEKLFADPLVGSGLIAFLLLVFLLMGAYDGAKKSDAEIREMGRKPLPLGCGISFIFFGPLLLCVGIPALIALLRRL